MRYTPILCQAPHPARVRREGYDAAAASGEIHELEIGGYGGEAEPTGRVFDRTIDVEPGHIVQRCLSRDCRKLTEYRITDR